MKQVQQIFILLTCILVMAAVAIRRDGRILGHELKAGAEDSPDIAVAETVTALADGTVVINTTELGKDIFGYAGPVPLEIYIKDGKVLQVKALENTETPSFFEEAAALLSEWDGKTIEEAQKLQVDVVSGATYSSLGIIENVQRGLAYAADNATQTSIWQKIDFSSKTIAALLVVLMGAVIPLIYRNKHYRLIQLILNVLVLGFWCGTFLSYTFFINALANGLNLWASLVPVIMLIVAFIYPLFGKKNHYCTHICPLGALQELAGKCNKKKWKMSAAMVKYLTWFREVLWVVLMILMLIGVGFSWIDYELFTAFIFRSATVVVLALAVVFILLSVFVPRPYCRFVCPTGTLFKISQNSK